MGIDIGLEHTPPSRGEAGSLTPDYAIEKRQQIWMVSPEKVKSVTMLKGYKGLKSEAEWNS
jgi:hypothetical protein